MGGMTRAMGFPGSEDFASMGVTVEPKGPSKASALAKNAVKSLQDVARVQAMGTSVDAAQGLNGPVTERIVERTIDRRAAGSRPKQPEMDEGYQL